MCILMLFSLKSITIMCHVQIICSKCNSLSSISFETNSELIRIKSSAVYREKLLLQSMQLKQLKKSGPKRKMQNAPARSGTRFVVPTFRSITVLAHYSTGTSGNGSFLHLNIRLVFVSAAFETFASCKQIEYLPTTLQMDLDNLYMCCQPGATSFLA
jgi:hypothetical protein